MPLVEEREPYLMELVANSWMTSATVVIEASPTSTSGTSTRMRSPIAPLHNRTELAAVVPSSGTQMRPPTAAAIVSFHEVLMLVVIWQTRRCRAPHD